MSLDVSGARQALTDIFQTRTLRRADGVTTESCGLSPRGGRLEEGGAAVQERGEYTLTLPGETTIALDHNEVITIDEIADRAFRVVWAPPPSNLNLTRRYGLVEVR